MHYIYEIINKTSGTRYIGQSVNPASRFRSHKSSTRNGSRTKLHNAMRSYGCDNFTMNILAEAPTKHIINILEIEYIKIYDVINTGYNICTGGEGISSEVAKNLITDERRANVSKRLKTLWKEKSFRDKIKESVSAYWTDAKREIASEKQKILWTNDRKEKRKSQLNIMWSSPEYMKSQSDAKKKHWADPEYRAKMCKMAKDMGNKDFLRNLAKNNWKDPERAKKMSQGRKDNNISVICLDTLKTYEKLMDAERDTGIKRRCITLNINGYTFRAGKMHWIKSNGNILSRHEADRIIIEMENRRSERIEQLWYARRNA